MSKTLSAENVSFRYPGSSHVVLKSASLELRLGSVVRIHGRNGSGKTTLLKLLPGILLPTQGRICGAEYAAYMDQSAGEMLADGMTIEEHLKISLRVNPAIASYLKSFGLGLDARLNEFIDHLSGGQRQIIALLSTLNSGRSFLCLDEFTSALDPRSVIAATEIIREEINQSKIGLIYVSHSSEWLEADEVFYIGDANEA